LLSQVKAAGALGPASTVVSGDVSISATSGSAAAWQIGHVQVGIPPADPPAPGRSSD